MGTKIFSGNYFQLLDEDKHLEMRNLYKKMLKVYQVEVEDVIESKSNNFILKNNLKPYLMKILKYGGGRLVGAAGRFFYDSYNENNNKINQEKFETENNKLFSEDGLFFELDDDKNDLDKDFINNIQSKSDKQEIDIHNKEMKNKEAILQNDINQYKELKNFSPEIKFKNANSKEDNLVDERTYLRKKLDELIDIKNNFFNNTKINIMESFSNDWHIEKKKIDYGLGVSDWE